MQTPPKANFEPVYLLPPSLSRRSNRRPRYTLHEEQMSGSSIAQNEPPSPPRLPATPLPRLHSLTPQDTFVSVDNSANQHGSSETPVGEREQASSSKPPRGILVSPKKSRHARGKTYPQFKQTTSPSLTNVDIKESFRVRARFVQSFTESGSIPYRTHQRSQSDGRIDSSEREIPHALQLIAKEVHINLVGPIFAQKDQCKILSQVQQLSLHLFWQKRLLFDADVVALPAFIRALAKLPLARWPLLQRLQEAEPLSGFSPFGLEGMTSLAEVLVAVSDHAQQEIVTSVLHLKNYFGHLPLLEMVRAFATYPFGQGEYFAAANEISAIYMGEDLSFKQFVRVLIDCFVCSGYIQQNPSTKIENQPSGCVSDAVEFEP